MMTTIGDKIKFWKQFRDYTQADMAEKLDISITAYAKIEQNKTDVNYSRLEQIAKVLDISMAELVSVNDKPSYYFSQCGQNGTYGAYGGFVVNNQIDATKLDTRINEVEKEMKDFRDEVLASVKELIKTIKKDK